MVKVVLLVNGRKRRKVCDIVKIGESYVGTSFVSRRIMGSVQNVGKSAISIADDNKASVITL